MSGFCHNNLLENRPRVQSSDGHRQENPTTRHCEGADLSPWYPKRPSPLAQSGNL